MHGERVQPLSLVQHIPEPLTIEPPLVQIIMRVIDAAPHIAIAALVVFAVYIHCRYTVRAVIVDNSAEFGDVDSDEMIALNALEDGDLDADDEGKGGGGQEQDGLAERRASAPSLQRFLRKVKSVVLLRRSTNAEDLAAPAQECSQPRNPFFSPPAQKPSEPTSTPPILRRMVTTAVKVVPVVATYRRTAFAALFIAVFFVDTERSKLGMAHPTFYELCMLIIVTFALLTWLRVRARVAAEAAAAAKAASARLRAIHSAIKAKRRARADRPEQGALADALASAVKEDAKHRRASTQRPYLVLK
jgi:hypothetical protein